MERKKNDATTRSRDPGIGGGGYTKIKNKTKTQHKTYFFVNSARNATPLGFFLFLYSSTDYLFRRERGAVFIIFVFVVRVSGVLQSSPFFVDTAAMEVLR